MKVDEFETNICYILYKVIVTVTDKVRITKSSSTSDKRPNEIFSHDKITNIKTFLFITTCDDIVCLWG